METSKSTSGLWVELVSADGLRTLPLAWLSKRQGSTASSIPEAETISMATGLKSEGLPMQDLFSAALGRRGHLRCLQDNTTAISAARAGYVFASTSTSTPCGAYLGGRPLRDPR